MTNILLISGSIRADSYTRALIEYIAEVLKKNGVEVFHWDLLKKPLPMMVPELRADVQHHPDAAVREFAEKATNCDAFVLGSPIYHNSYSGVLKNALDHLRNPHFSYKPVGLVSFGGDRSKQAVDQLRIVARAWSAIAIPTIVCADEEDFNGKEMTSKDIIDRINRFCDELILFAETMKPLREKKAVKDK